MNKFAGIGSRSTPKNILELMIDLGAKFGKAGWLLRSGGADGADSAFEEGCHLVKGTKEIYLPWKYFNKNTSPLYPPSSAAKRLAATIHPAWNKCSDAAKLLHARNCHQILGPNLDDPVNMVICWTENGEIKGGTATAINLALQNSIPVFNLSKEIQEQLKIIKDLLYV